MTAVAAAATDTMKVAATDGVMTTVHDFGGDGPVLLFVHATGMHARVWKPVADHLLDRAHCLALDLRGHGDSSMPPDCDFGWDGFGNDVVGAVRAVAGGGAVVGVGHSLGGAALLMAELQAPGTFDRLFLYEPAVHTEVGEDGWEALLAARDAMVQVTRRRRSTFSSRPEALANYAAKAPMSQFQAAVLSAYVEHGFTERTGSTGPEVTLKCSPETESRIYAASYGHKTAQRVHAIGCAVTVAAGNETDPLQRRTVARLAAQFGVDPVLLSGVDHFGPMQQPKQFADAVASHVLDV